MNTEIQVPAESSNPQPLTVADIQPLYFMFGFLCGLVFLNLFKGRWFL